jgi:outer membrane protein assembly factor BamB
MTCLRIIISTVVVAGSTPLTTFANDWPMWRYDAGRTAESPQQLPADLDLLWRRDLPQPRPAFNDVRLQFDGGYEPIVKGQRLFLASNTEDSITAFDTHTGKELWQFFADGPVRLAPVAWKGNVIFGSDDGHLYCVAATDGKLRWKFKAVPSDRKLLGNKRLISVWPIRGGPVLKDDRIYFAAGVWPFEGVFIYCLDVATGKKIWLNDSTGHIYGPQPHNAVAIGGIAPQGYLLINGDDLVVPSSNAYPGRFDLRTGQLKDFKLPSAGRLTGGWYASLPGKAEQKKTKRKSLLADLGVNVIRHEDRLRFEGKPEIRTTIRAGEQVFRFTNGFPNVTGTIHSMAVANGKLFVSTVEGGLYAFGAANGKAPRRFPNRQSGLTNKPMDRSAKLLKAISGRHGYGVFLGAPDAATLQHLATETELHFIVIERSAKRVQQLRRELVPSGLYGSRIAALPADPATFELPPYFANCIIVDRNTNLNEEARQRIFHSVRPYGGQLIVETATGPAITTRDGALPGSSNYDGDFSISPDELVKAPLGVLWFDDTLGHFKRSPQPKFVDGVMVSTTKDWLDASTRKGKVDYRLLPPTFSDVYTGRVLTDEETGFLKKQSFAKVDLKTVQPSQYRPRTQVNDWKPDAPKAGFRKNPLTGEKEPRTFPKSYGCDGGFDYGNIYTMRSGTAAFYDKRTDSGTINISGPRSGCTSSVIPANGVLNVPYFYKGCTCSYPLPTGLSLFSLPETHEQWTSWGKTSADKLAGKIQRIGINFGAPADRMTEAGTLWLDHPSAGGPSPAISIETVPAKPTAYYHHSVWMKGGDGWPWVAASGVENLDSVKINGLKPGKYRVSLTFANPDNQKRSFNLRVQDQLVAKGFSSGSRMISTTKRFDNIASDGSLRVALTKKVGKTQLSGIEIVAMHLANE